MEIILTLFCSSMLLLSQPQTIDCENKAIIILHELPDNITGEFKTYMPYTAIKDPRSYQWKLQQRATTDSRGYRMYDDRYMIALGTHYAPRAGVLIDIVLEDGTHIPCITGDVKDNRHTDSTNRYITHNGNVVEFIVDPDKLPRIARKMGDMQYNGMKGKIVTISEVKLIVK